jgi:phosphoribosylformylglycinamidine synthase
VSARIGVVVFPGTNCEHDVVKALSALAGEEALAATVELVWHGERSLSQLDGVVLPGGFAHGDYLRPGAIARFSSVTDALARFAAEGGPVVGICNGFQVLTEAGLLPGALQKNSGLHFEGNYTCDQRTLDRLRAEDCVVLRYEENPNGSVDDIAGVCNAAGNVVGLMPHPERACDMLTGALDGAPLLRSLLDAADQHASLPA